jgi:hypothetical protein
MEIYNNTLCIPANQYYHEYDLGPGRGKVVKRNFVSYDTYKLQKKSKLKIVRPGKGEGNHALIDLESIPSKYRNEIGKREPNPELSAVITPFIDQVKMDYEAVRFYTNFRYPNGRPIPTDKVDNIKLWSNNAAIMNAISADYDKHVRDRANQGKGPIKSTFFKNHVVPVKSKELNDKWPNNLPTNASRLQEKFDDYKELRYMAFVKNLVGNDNAVKINSKILDLLIFISVMPTRPYTTEVKKVYDDFMAGRIELVNHATGEEYLPEDYLDETGNVIQFTEAAIWQRIEKPSQQVKVDKKRMGAKDFNDLHRPHRHRHSPEYSFSKISMDDRDLVWKDAVSKQRVKAYYAYDVASGCRIGSAYSMFKNEELFLDCLRDMFAFIDRNGFGSPLEIEVENHLVNKFFDDLAVMFPYLTICAPGNSQEKRAEHFNRAVKYQVEKNNHPGIGRWWLSSKYNRISVDKVNDQFKQKMKMADRMIIDDIQDSLEYNNALHKNQKKYPGMTRMDVLRANLNPGLPKLNKPFLYKYIGYETETSIVRNQYVSVQYEKYMLPNPRVLELLAPNNRNVTAYYMPNADGTISEVYLYQYGRLLCTCERLETYNESKAERTDVDVTAKLKQDKYVAMFDKYVKDGTSEMAKLEILKPNTEAFASPMIVADRKTEPDSEPESDTTDYRRKAIDDFFN